MYIAKCPACGYVIGRVMNPASLPTIVCPRCKINHFMQHCIDPYQRYEDPEENEVKQRVRYLTHKIIQ